MSDPPTLESRRFTAADGTALVGDLAIPASAEMAAIVCHPHPQYGGDRFNHVVSAIFQTLPHAGIAALRFDFRTDFSGGAGERLDAVAAVDELVTAVPGVAVAAVGYSFGAMIALALDDDRISALGLVAPPLAMAPDVAAPSVRTLVLTPAHDQFSPPTASTPVVDRWRVAGAPGAIEHRTIEMADHSLVGHTADVADQLAAWLSERPPPPSPPSPRR